VRFGYAQRTRKADFLKKFLKNHFLGLQMKLADKKIFLSLLFLFGYFCVIFVLNRYAS
jgi:hypothetical protein